jgi:cytochrome d ubiquinol oxidase subunit II
VWDGNEVWLLAAGGTLYFAFPHVYASGFSGFYLPLMMVLWLLMLRGLGIELRHHLHNTLWHTFFDAVFSFASLLLTIFFGAALGNVIRGVPINSEGYFFEPLWTTFTVVPEAGILDWYTVTIAIVAVFAITLHGAAFIAMKTEGAVHERSRAIVGYSWWGLAAASIAGGIATCSIRPELTGNFTAYPWGWVFPLGGAAGLAGILHSVRHRRDTRMFLYSSGFIVCMLAVTAFMLYPNLLTSSSDPSRNLSVHNAAAQAYGLEAGLVWFAIGIALTAGYFVYLYRAFRGKVGLPADDGGY